MSHGMYGTPTYTSWSSMKKRCDNPKEQSYYRYGGRGISYPILWASFKWFFEDMGLRPDGHTLDRVDPNKDYSKENCQWADSFTQSCSKAAYNELGEKHIQRKRDKFRVEINRKGVKITSRVVDTLEAAIEMRDLLLEEM